MAKVIEATEPRLAWTIMSPLGTLNIALQGALVGVVTYALYLLLVNYVFTPILCNQANDVGRCDSAPAFAGAMAILIGSMLGLILLIRERVYRPLLAILGIVVGLWGVFGLVVNLPWIAAALIIVATFALAYALFSWLVQPASLMAGAVAVLVVAVLIRFILSA